MPVPVPVADAAAAAGTWPLGDLSVNRFGFGAMRLTGDPPFAAIAPVVCVQNRFSLDDQTHHDMLRACRERGIAFVPFFAVAGDRRRAGGPGTPSTALEEVAERHGATPSQVRLAWTLHQGPNVLAIPGTGNPAHLDENVAAAALHLTADDLALLP
jgi:aryl-alcohol dehydrogenase-like predicted oxidoreductase